MLELVKAIWPFVSEMFFHGKSMKDVILANKMLSFILLLLLASVSLNYMALGKIYDIAVSRREENAKQGAGKPTLGTPHQVTEPPNAASAASSPTSNNQDDELAKRRELLKNTFKD